MCVAVTGKLIRREGDAGKVDVRGNIISVELGIVDAVVGDYVLVHAGCAIAKVSKDENDMLNSLLKEISNE